jgi:hypothetical protein
VSAPRIRRLPLIGQHQHRHPLHPVEPRDATSALVTSGRSVQ